MNKLLLTTLLWGAVTSSSWATMHENGSVVALLDTPISLNFKEANVKQVMDVVSQSTGVNFIFDNDVGTDLKTTIYANNAKMSEALDLILTTNSLRYKVINQKTYLIYNDTLDKMQQYEDLQIKTFVLKNGDAKKIQDVLKTIVNPKFMYIDEKNRLITLRDRNEVLKTAEKIIDVYDQPDPEVVLELKVYEVSNELLNNLGIALPNKVSLSPISLSGQNGVLNLKDLLNMSKTTTSVAGVSPLLTLNLQDTNGNVSLLARPSLRVKNLEKAKIVVGDKIPVITSTINQVSNAITESISYLDVGLTLEVQPEIHVNDEVNIKVGLEVSNIVKEIRTNTGLLTYQIGTRNANTVLQLKDGETEVLAGLIREQERKSNTNIPFLGRIPILGALFSSRSKDKNRSEIILSITPKIIRKNTERLNYTQEFDSGTYDYISLKSNTSPATFKGEVVHGGGKTTQVETVSEQINEPSSKTSSENKIQVTVPEHITSAEPANIFIEAGTILKGTKLTVHFDRQAFSFSDIRLMTQAVQAVNYKTLADGVEIRLNEDLKQQSLAIIALQPLNEFKGKGEINIDIVHPQSAKQNIKKIVDIK